MSTSNQYLKEIKNLKDSNMNDKNRDHSNNYQRNSYRDRDKYLFSIIKG